MMAAAAARRRWRGDYVVFPHLARSAPFASVASVRPLRCHIPQCRWQESFRRESVSGHFFLHRVFLRLASIPVPKPSILKMRADETL